MNDTSEFELTAEEAMEFDKLVDPDANEGGDTYKWDEEFQQELLGLLMHDRDFLLETKSLIKPNYFIKESHRWMTEIIFSHFDKYSTLPTRVQLTHELRSKVADKSDEIQIQTIGDLNSILMDYTPGLESRDYYRDKIVNFAKTQALKFAFHNCLEAIKKAPESDGTWSKVNEMLREALSVEHNFEEGQDYFKSYKERYERMNQVLVAGDTFSTGFHSIDSALQAEGLKRGEIASVMGVSGSGKSIFLKVASIANLNRGKKVLYISLEIDQDGVAQRFDAEIANMSATLEDITGLDRGVTIKNLLQKKEIVFQAIEEYRKVIEDDVNDEITKRLIIKQFPSGHMDMTTFMAYYSQLCLRGFKPDLIIIDYVGEMKDYPDIPTHESRYRITRDLRGFAVKENICIMTAMQPNRSAKEAVKQGILIDDENLGDSFAQIKPLDAFWTINQLQDEKNAGIARLYVAKHREGESRYTVYVQFDYKTLTIKEITQELYEKIYREYQNMRAKRSTDLVKEDLQARNVDDIIGHKKMSDIAYSSEEPNEIMNGA